MGKFWCWISTWKSKNIMQNIQHSTWASVDYLSCLDNKELFIISFMRENIVNKHMTISILYKIGTFDQNLQDITYSGSNELKCISSRARWSF